MGYLRTSSAGGFSRRAYGRTQGSRAVYMELQTLANFVFSSSALNLFFTYQAQNNTRLSKNSRQTPARCSFTVFLSSSYLSSPFSINPLLFLKVSTKSLLLLGLLHPAASALMVICSALWLTMAPHGGQKCSAHALPQEVWR